jgi:type I restriction enzyme R subunit
VVPLGTVRRRQLKVKTVADETVTLVIELKPETVAPEKIRVEGLEVTIADEATFLVEATGEQLSLDQYLDYTRRKVVGYVPEWEVVGGVGGAGQAPGVPG